MIRARLASIAGNSVARATPEIAMGPGGVGYVPAGTVIAASSAGGPPGIVIGLAVAGASIAMQLLLGRKGGKQKRAATAIVNDIEPLLQQNVEAFRNGPRTPESKEVALATFDNAWRWLTSAEGCGDRALGNPGQACINDRAPGGKHDWFALYRDPIETAPTQTVDAATAIAEATEGVPWWAWAALAGAVAVAI